MCNPSCTVDAANRSKDATTQATLSTAAISVGVVAIAGACVLWFTAPKSSASETKLALDVGPTGVQVRGGF
jgi:hypothetical protein